MKAGDDVTVAYVDITQHADETPLEARRRRRTELVRGWRFACQCQRCVLEDSANADSDAFQVQTDESKVEDAVNRMEERKADSQSDTID
jgi:mitochondrial import receptor subunit TOM20